MTTPEENAPKTTDTDQVVFRPDGDPDQEPRTNPDSDDRPAVGAELRDRLAEKGLSEDDLTS
ncbi:hypothetical protein [Actinomadura flavalba]|uniref:hypothetical protein n=1 Tax=Actinomadura flavalba TaxID=1120938 RepID=UPI0003649240|nr:hypothetical protein [Actinomadura flavalba]